MPMVNWKFGGMNGACQVETGTALIPALQAAGVPLELPCGGHHTCGKCRVLAEGVLSEPAEEEKRLLGGDLRRGIRLACYLRVEGDCRICGELQDGQRIALDHAANPAALDPLYEGWFGAAFDIGTTTVVGYLFSREVSEPLAVLGEMNRQGRYGADVLSRIDYCAAHGVAPLQTLICEQLGDMLRSLCEAAQVPIGDLSGLCITGNTTMLHLLTGLDPYSLSQAPFTPCSLFGDTWNLPIPGFSGITAYLPRCVSAYVGGDISCSVLASGILRRPGNRLLVDVGTNGEMVLKIGDALYCCATAAGPAFEGAGISCGSSARNGAIHQVDLVHGEICCQIIGGDTAESLCGTGLIDAVACFLKTGMVDYRGRIAKQWGGQLPLRDRVFVTQADIRQLQLAKGAIRAGMDTLMDAAAMPYDQVDEIIFCGGFGNCVRPETAAAIGLIPLELMGRTQAIGNAAGTGAGWTLQSRCWIDEMNAAAERMQVVELSNSKFFQKRYIEAMNFPQA